MMRKTIGILSAILLMTGIAVAYAVLTVDPFTQDINVGETGTYTITLNTDDTGSAALQWSTSDPLILASINGAALATDGTYTFTSTGVDGQTFTLNVQPQDGVTIDQSYEIEVDYKGGPGRKVKAIVTAGVVPVPEIATAGLVGAGVIGLVALRRRKG